MCSGILCVRVCIVPIARPNKARLRVAAEPWDFPPIAQVSPFQAYADSVVIAAEC